MFEKDGAQGRNRTADTGIFNPLLYRLSYLGARSEARIKPLHGPVVKRPALIIDDDFNPPVTLTALWRLVGVNGLGVGKTCH